MTLAPGTCLDSADGTNIVLAGGVNIDITASGVNGLDTGSEAASTFYAVYVIDDSTGVNAAAGLLSLATITPTTLPPCL